MNNPYDSGFTFFSLLLWAWSILTFVQVLMSYGPAYRRTKIGGDNGVALFGWLIVFYLAALIPGLGIYLWKKSKDWDAPPPSHYRGANPAPRSYGPSPGANMPGANPAPQPYKPIPGANVPDSRVNADKYVTPTAADLPGKVTFPLCKAEQLMGRKFCFRCGANFVETPKEG